jgi:ribonuclease T1
MIGKWLRYSALAVAVSASGVPDLVSTAWARQPSSLDAPFGATLGEVPLAGLPREARSTFKLIQAGGPFPYAKDGTVFGNIERRLPVQPRGYYHEYTVKASSRARHRGTRRIICGGPPHYIGDCYYTGDHYTSFKRIVWDDDAYERQHLFAKRRGRERYFRAE